MTTQQDLDIQQIVGDILTTRCPDLVWEIKYSDKLYNCLGKCHNTIKNGKYTSTLTFSQPFFNFCRQNGNIEDMRDTVLHEVAHAITFYNYGKGHGHDSVWKRIVAGLGASPSSEAHLEAYKPYRYTYKCPICGTETKTLRKYNNGIACAACCRKYNNGRYSEKYEVYLAEDKGRVVY